MKKFLLLLMAMVMLPVAMEAQSMNAPQADGLWQRVNALQNFDTRHKAPAKMDLPANQKILGHYDTDEVQTGGYLGLTGFPGVIPTAIELTPDELAIFQGGKIVAFRVGIASSTPITRVFAAPSTASGLGEFTEWTCNASAEGWNVIPVDPPYEINLDENTGLFVGFDYKQTSSNYPISAVMAGNISPTYMYLTYQGQTAWFDLGLEDYGNLSLQVIVESDNYPEYALNLGRLTCSGKYIQQGEPLEYTLNVKNGGTGTIEVGALVCDVLVNGEKVGEITNDVAIGGSYVGITGTLSTEGLESGAAYTLEVVPASLNGEAIENPKSAQYEFFIVSKLFPRQKHLLEQFTSNSCTYCPLGTSMIEVLQGMRDDIARVAVHGNMNSVDPTNTAQCDTIFSYVGCQGWPYATFDRMTGWEDDSNIANGIGYNASYHQQVAAALSSFYDDIAASMPTFATININNEVNLLTRDAKVTVSGEITPDFEAMMGSDAKLTVYITEDSIIYRQLNNGRWVSNYRHDGVLRQALGTVKGVDLNKDGETYCNEFELTVPDAWNIEKMNVIAFISRPLINGASKVYTDMYVNNTDMTHIPTISSQMTDSTVVITAAGKGEVQLYVNDEPVENVYTIVRGEEDVTLTVKVTAQDGDKLMNTVTTEVVVPAKETDGVNELFATDKNVARVRYFNVMGQEMTRAQGATIVVTTYTDGSISVSKLMK